MQLVDHPFVKFDQLKPIYNFTYPLFRTISDKFRSYINYSELIDCDKVPRAQSVSLYLHVPFCETICSFCPFQKGAYKHASQIDDYTDALVREISIKGNFVRSLGGRIRTIYIGGGSPSVLSAENIRKLGSLLHSEFDLTSLDEFTFECEPKSVTKEKLYAAREIGVNRISFGIQTFVERFRALFDLTSSREQIENTVHWSQEIIGRVGFDILYGMHGHLSEEFIHDLKRATELQPETINLYPINNISITPKLHKLYSVKAMEPSSLAHRQVLRLFGDTVLRECGYAPCNGHSYIRDANCGLLNLAGMCSADNFRYHKYLHGYHDDYVVGFGASAQSILGPLITRANPNRSDYIADTREHGAPKVHYNWAPTRQSASKALCMRLPYSGYVEKERIDWRNVDPFVRENLRRVIKAGLVVEDERCMQLTRTGWQWYSGLMFYLLPQADRAILDDYVAEMLNAPAVLDGATEVFTAA